MNSDIEVLKKEFRRIKRRGLIESLRSGPTGVGYTFETLLNKKEDQECKPDFNSIELKCKLAYSKSLLCLFNCVPTRNGESAIKYIFENYNHYRYGNKNSYKLFERKVYSKYYIERFKISFKLKVDYINTEVVMKSYFDGIFIEDVCKWNFKVLERKLKSKLNFLAIVQAYPYNVENKLYYKYVKMNIYKLKGFFEFLQLIENDKINVSFYMRETISDSGEKIIEDHGVGFKIKTKYIEELFYEIKT
ncbi:MAG: hypothetical protein E7313_06400 [Clostridiales bacterium]|nr:hypothetical protein [Clostridiales bacterium]